MCWSPGSGPSGRSRTGKNKHHGLSVFRVEYLVVRSLLWHQVASNLTFYWVLVWRMRQIVFIVRDLKGGD